MLRLGYLHYISKWKTLQTLICLKILPNSLLSVSEFSRQKCLSEFSLKFRLNLAKPFKFLKMLSFIISSIKLSSNSIFTSSKIGLSSNPGITEWYFLEV